MVTKTKKGYVSLANEGEDINRRQDAPQCFDVTTVAYAAKIEFILRQTHYGKGKWLVLKSQLNVR